jgi:hypothetical protein
LERVGDRNLDPVTPVGFYQWPRILSIDKKHLFLISIGSKSTRCNIKMILSCDVGFGKWLVYGIRLILKGAPWISVM